MVPMNSRDDAQGDGCERCTWGFFDLRRLRPANALARKKKMAQRPEIIINITQSKTQEHGQDTARIQRRPGARLGAGSFWRAPRGRTLGAPEKSVVQGEGGGPVEAHCKTAQESLTVISAGNRLGGTGDLGP